ncbi:hypothetical protein [Actinokineospora pegani]|uniref:hypothetical protein n=1 Tax=Actinokineospora pegani TaxID=2654637 RepID=UPI0012EAF033|nr:hypothetical protein [Actinokineospora pegani]
MRRTTPTNIHQVDLFDPDTPAPPAPEPTPIPRRRRPPRTPNPKAAQEILDFATTGRLGVLDDSDRIVAINRDDDRAREVPDSDTVHALIASGYLEPGPNRDVVDARWGITRKPVTPLRLTKTGRALLGRWAALKPI